MFTIVMNAAKRMRDEIWKQTGRPPSAVGLQLDADSFARAVLGWAERLRVCDDATAAGDEAMRTGILLTNAVGFTLELRRAPERT